jgi:hypothetical protein
VRRAVEDGGLAVPVRRRPGGGRSRFGIEIRAHDHATGPAGAPRSGTVHGSLNPSGQETVTVQATYQIQAAPDVAPSAGASGPVTLPAGDGAQAAAADVNRRQIRSVSPTVSRIRSVVPVTGATFGLFGVLTVMVILSLRGVGDHSSRQLDVRSK